MILVFTACSFFVSLPGYSVEYKVVLADLPVFAESADKGISVELIKAIEDVSGNSFAIKVYPFARSMQNVIKGDADFHFPLIKNDQVPEQNLPYSYSTETIFHVNFVLYTRKDSEVNLSNLSNYVVETDRAHIDYFPFKTTSSSANLNLTLTKLSKGRIDAFIFADSVVDPVLKKLKINNIQRRLYKSFEVKIILAKS